MKKRGFWAAIILLGMVLCGCGTGGESEEMVSSKQEVQEEKNFRNPDKETTEPEVQTQEEVLSELSLWGQDMYASPILEDEDTFYFVGKEHIRSIGKESGIETHLWDDGTRKEEYSIMTYASTGGIRILDRIYFVEKWENQENPNEWQYALSVIGTDGTGYERIREFQYGLENGMILIDGVLYYEKMRNSLDLKGYAVDQNGNVLTEKEVYAKAEQIPEDYVLPYIYHNGLKPLSAVESKSRFGFYLLYNAEYDLCKIDPETGKEEKLPNYLDAYSLQAVNDTYFLFASYVEEKMYLFEYKTGAVRSLGDFDSDCTVIAMDEEYLYLQRTVNGDDFTQYHYEQISLKKAEVEELFVVDRMVGVSVANPQTLMQVTVSDGYIYYPGTMDDYKLYVLRRAVEMSNAVEILGSEYYDSKISEIGSIKNYRQAIYSKHIPDWVTASVDLEWLVVDNQFAGAANINRILEEEQQQNIACAQQNAKLQDDLYLEAGEDYPTISFSIDSTMSKISYWDGSYMSFVQQSYDYSGGAHGMPYWNGYVFNVHTGEQLGIADIVQDDEIQIKGLVTQYFTEMYKEDPDMYWDGAIDTVFEYITLDSQFYLNEEGIVFYFGPYDLASYAAGFQEIIVPYSAWNLKIELDY